MQAFWVGLDEVLSVVGGSATGFLEYYGAYYLVADDEDGIALYSLGLTKPFIGLLPLDEFCKNAWAFYCYIENSPETIYGGDGLNLPNLT